MQTFWNIEAPAASFETIPQEQAYALMQAGDCIILDVRTQGEYDAAHIPGAICVPVENIADVEPEELPDKDQLILVYCRSGHRSRIAAQKLADMGYTSIKDFGGIMTWPYETESE